MSLHILVLECLIIVCSTGPSLLFADNWFPNVPCVISAILTPNGDRVRIV